MLALARCPCPCFLDEWITSANQISKALGRDWLCKVTRSCSGSLGIYIAIYSAMGRVALVSL